jgi:hypothetical protein
MATSLASCEAIWLCKMLTGLFGLEMGPTDPLVITKVVSSFHPMFHDRSKHIEIRYHFIRDKVQRGVVRLQYISTGEHITNILTKPLVKGKFVFFKDKLGVVENPFFARREC